MASFGSFSLLISLLWPAYVSKGVYAAPIDRTLICIPTTWSDVVTFFLENYVTHAGTVLSIPGVVWHRNIIWKIGVIFIPFVGFRYTLGLLCRKIILWDKRDDIHNALSRGALLAVARGPSWRPLDYPCYNEVYLQLPQGFHSVPIALSKADIPRSSASLQFTPYTGTISDNLSISGNIGPLPEGYVWSTLDVHTSNILLPDSPTRNNVSGNPDNSQYTLPRTHSFLQMGVSMAQLFFSAVTLYRTKGSQLDHYGYAAYGLTVFPYNLMSFINLIGALVLGEYPYIYVLNTKVLQEAAQRGGRFDGCVGYVQETETLHNEIPESTQYTLARLSIRLEDENQVLVVQTGDDTREFDMLSGSTSEYIFQVQSTTHSSTLPLPSFVFRLDLLGAVMTICKNIKQASRDNGISIFASVGAHFELKGTTSEILARLFEVVIFGGAVLLPYAFIYAMTGFKAADSTVSDRAWAMAWLSTGRLLGVTVFTFYRAPMSHWSRLQWIALCIIVSGALTSAIGGFVKVGQTYITSGTCALERL